jgi:hypothetical protein
MQKTTTSLKKTDLTTKSKETFEPLEMQPSSESLKRIMQFAASYRVQTIAKNQFVEMMMN